VLPRSFAHFFHNGTLKAELMTETSAVDLRVRLPRSLAEEVKRVKESDPEALSRIVAYGVTRRMIFDHLVARGGAVVTPEERRY
jgi:hypothetical protein